MTAAKTESSRKKVRRMQGTSPGAGRVAQRSGRLEVAREVGQHVRMFGRWLSSARNLETPAGSEEILARVREHLPDADDETARVVAALGGLLAAVAYADRDYSTAEEAVVRTLLARIHGLTEPGIEAICAAMRRHVVEVSAVGIPRLTRELRELGDPELRRDVLDALVDLAAADGRITVTETNLLRQLTTSLGLSQSDYNEAQSRHRDRLAILKNES